MFSEYFEAGGLVMYLLFVAWVVVLAGVLDRALYATGILLRRPGKRMVRNARTDRASCDVESLLERERRLATRGLGRIDSVSQLATSLGLFGTVLGISKAFFAKGMDMGLAAPEVLASGLATALFTTVAGLVIFLFGQGFLIVWREWTEFRHRRLEELLLEATR